jgi:hypothetical protein
MIAATGICVVCVIALSGCGDAPRAGLRCDGQQADGAELMKGADVVVLGSILDYRETGLKSTMKRLPDGGNVPGRAISVLLDVSRVLKGSLPAGAKSGSKITFIYWEAYGLATTGGPRGITTGPALVPLREDDSSFRAVQDCWVPSIPLGWMPAAPVLRPQVNAFEETVVDLLLSAGPDDTEWPINREADLISDGLIGGVKTSRRLLALAAMPSQIGETACALLCRRYGQCQCAIERLKSRTATDPARLKEAIRFAHSFSESLEHPLRWRNWPALLAATRTSSKEDALAILKLRDAPMIRRLAGDLSK